ncbi:MAG: AAA family ATPase [Candidatus Marsarchaeota archaeon]|nr:AAA family ATPase [Candidatus Marsarchaeota archaeon]
MPGGDKKTNAASSKNPRQVPAVDMPAKGAGQALKYNKPIKRERTHVPLSIYWIKDFLRDFVNHNYFPDSVLSVFALASLALAFPFYPILVIVPILIAVFFLSRFHPLIGLMLLLFSTLPMLIYQAPLLAWIFTLLITISLIAGYRHYRTITLVYALFSLPFSPIGVILEIPTFVFGILFVGFKRGLVVAALTIILASAFSGLTNIPLNGPIIYNTSSFSAAAAGNPALPFLEPSSPAPSLYSFPSALASIGGKFINFKSDEYIFNSISLFIEAIYVNIFTVVVQMLVWLFVVFTISSYVIKSRSAYKGAEASIYSIIILISYFALAFFLRYASDFNVWISFIITPPFILALEFNDIKVVRALEVMKQDFLGKFGEAFEELANGSRETLDDIGNYEETKEELRNAVLAPIEHREIAGAYNIKPAKGILLFGPPGTGKTLIMRALSNEIRARFFYVKTSSILSPYSGEAAQALSKIFTMARKHAPSVLFFDEIDGIAAKRDAQESDSSRQLLSTLLSEMDGFQKIEGVVVVGSTNVPQMLDPSIMRPGRFDKVIYMSLPDEHGREQIFMKCAEKYPVSNTFDYEKLAQATSRFSGADIANVMAESARMVSEIAIKNVKVLKINTADVLSVIKATKPSTSLSHVAEYERFKLDYERRMHPERQEKDEEGVKFSEVIGLAEVKKAVREAIEIPLLHPELIKKYGISRISGILIFGPPGTGKTMLMNAVANEIGSFRMIRISGTDLSKQGLEKATAALKETFDRAKENAPAVIFIDEIDSIIPAREDASEFSVQLTSEFLQEMDSAKDIDGIVVVGSTNRPDSIDPAMLRPGRFDKIVFAPPPNKEERAKIFEINLTKVPIMGGIDFEKLAEESQGYTGADIVNVCRQAKMNALEAALDSSKETQITMQDIEKLIKATKPSAPTVVIGRYLAFLSTHSRG